MRKKQTKADFLRSWGINDPVLIKAGLNWLRYKNPPEKGIYWYYLSLWVRQRDVEAFGTCISCGCPITVETSQAGHFCPASNCGRDLLFDPLNVNAECSRCNAWDEGHLFGYEHNLKERYGDVAVDKLKAKYMARRKNKDPVKDWKGSEYADKIRELPSYQQRIAAQ